MLPEPVLVSDWLRLGGFGNMVVSRLSYQMNECNCVFHALQISKESAEYMVEEYKRLRQRDSTGGIYCCNTPTMVGMAMHCHGNTLPLSESIVELKCKVWTPFML